MSDGKADRFNTGKPRLFFNALGREVQDGEAAVWEVGAKKYASGNWLKGTPWTEAVDSILRHLAPFLAGEDLDRESGLPHVDHIVCDAKILSNAFHVRKDLDDRPCSIGVEVADGLSRSILQSGAGTELGEAENTIKGSGHEIWWIDETDEEEVLPPPREEAYRALQDVAKEEVKLAPRTDDVEYLDQHDPIGRWVSRLYAGDPLNPRSFTNHYDDEGGTFSHRVFGDKTVSLDCRKRGSTAVKASDVSSA